MTIPRLWPWKKEEQEQLLPDSDELLRASLPGADELLRISAPPTIPTAAPITARPPDSYVPPQPVVPSTSRWPESPEGEPARRRRMLGEAYGVPSVEQIPIEQAGPVRRGLETGIEFGKETVGESMRQFGRFLREGPQATPGQLEERTEVAPPYPTVGAPRDTRHQVYPGESSRRRAMLAQVVGTQPEAPSAVSGYLETRGPEIAEQARARMEQIPRPKRLSDVKTIGDALDWAAFSVAQGVASSAPSIVGGIAGGAVGGIGGAAAGAMLPGYLMNQNEVRRSLVEEGVPVEEADRISTLAAIPMAALDVLLPARLGSKLTGPVRDQVVRSVAKRMAAEVGTNMTLEGITEAAQSIIEQATTLAVTGRPIDIAQALEEGFAGSLTGGVLGGAGQVYTEARMGRQPPAPPIETPLADQLLALEAVAPSRPPPADRPRDEPLAPPREPELAPEPRIGGAAPQEPLPPVVSPTEQAGGIPLGPEPPAPVQESGKWLPQELTPPDQPSLADAVEPELRPEPPLAPPVAPDPVEAYKQSIRAMDDKQIQQQVDQVYERLQEAAKAEFGEPGIKAPEVPGGVEKRDLEMNKQRWEALEPEFIRRSMGEWPEIEVPEQRPAPSELEVEPSPEGEPDKVLIGHIKAYLEKEQTPEIQKAIDGLLEGKTPAERTDIMRRARFGDETPEQQQARVAKTVRGFEEPAPPIEEGRPEPVAPPEPVQAEPRDAILSEVREAEEKVMREEWEKPESVQHRAALEKDGQVVPTFEEYVGKPPKRLSHSAAVDYLTKPWWPWKEAFKTKKVLKAELKTAIDAGELEFAGTRGINVTYATRAAPSGEGTKKIGYDSFTTESIENWLADKIAAVRAPAEAVVEPEAIQEAPVEGVETIWRKPEAEFVDATEVRKRERSFYFTEEGEKIASSRTTPQEASPYEVGQWRIDREVSGAYGHDIEQLREYDANELVATEDVDATKKEDVGRYREWAKQGRPIPPVEAVEGLSKTGEPIVMVTNGHRRLAVAKELGVPIRAWVSPMTDVPGITDAEGKPIPTGLTRELALYEAAQTKQDVPVELLREAIEAAPSLAERIKKGGIKVEGIEPPAAEVAAPKPKKAAKQKKEPTPNARKLRYLREIKKAMPKPADRRGRFARGETADEMAAIEERFVDDYDRDLIDRSQYYRLRQELEGRPVAEIPIEDEAGEVKKVLATNLDSEDLADHWVKVANRAQETSLIAGDQWVRFDENIQATRASHSESSGKAQKRVAQDKGVLTKVEGELFSRGWTFQDLIDRQSPGPEETALEAGAPADQAAAQGDVFGGETLVGEEQAQLLGPDVGKRTAKLGEEQISAEEMAERAEPAEPEGEVPLELEPEAKPSQTAITKIEDVVTGKPFAGKLYRGSGRVDPEAAYNPLGAKVPVLGPGRYTTSEEEFAQQFGPNVEEVDVRIKKPLVIRDDSHWRTLTQEAGWTHVNPFGQDPKKTEAQIDDLRKLIEERGYDGVIVVPSGRGDDAKALWNVFSDVTAVEFEKAPAVEAKKPKQKRITKPKWYKLNMPESELAGLSDEELDKAAQYLSKTPPKAMTYEETQMRLADLQHVFNQKARNRGDLTMEEQARVLGGEEVVPGGPLVKQRVTHRVVNGSEREYVIRTMRAPFTQERYDAFLTGRPDGAEMRTGGKFPSAEIDGHGQWISYEFDKDVVEYMEGLDDEIVGSPGTENFDEIVGSPPADLVSPEGRNEAADRQANIGYGLEGNLEKPSDWKKGDKITEPEVMHLLSDIAVAAGRPVPTRVGRMVTTGLGEFKVGPEVIRVRRANDIPVASHEVGHAIEKLVFGWEKGGAWKKPRASGKMQKELFALGKALYGDRKPSGGYKREGWAEFWKKWMKEEKGLEQAAPELYKWFHEEFLPLYPDIATAASKARDGVRTWREQGAVERGRTKLVDPASIPERLQRAKEKVQLAFSMEKMVEMAQPLFELSKATNKKLAEQGKGPLPYSKDPYLIAAALRTVQAARTKYMIEDGMIDLAGNKVGPSLRDATNLVKGKQDDFGLYLYGKRSLAMWGDPQGFRDPGISRQDAEQIVEELGSEEFEAAAAKLYAWLDGVLDYMAEASPTFANVVANTRARDPGSYIPLARYFEEIDDMWAKSVGRTASQRSPVKHLKGSGRRIKEPFAQIIGQTEQMVRSAHARMVIDAIIKVSRVEGMGHIIEEVPREMVPAATASLKEVIKLANKELKGRGLPELDLEGDEIKLSDLNDEDLAQSITFFAPATWPKGVDPVVPIYAEGEVKWYRVDGKLYDTLSSLDVYRLPDVAGLPLLEWGLGKPAAAFRAGTTGLRASFGLITNPIRDFQTLYVNSRASANGAKLFWYWAHSMSSAMLNRASGGMAHPSEWLEAFTRLGGEMAQPLGQDIPHTRLAARKLFQGRTVKLVDPRNIFEFYRDLIQAPEMGARVAELRAVAKDIGWEPGMPMTLDQSLQMLLAGKQVSTDFTAAGELARMMNRMAPFFNAAIQGPRANLRAAKANKMKFAWRGAQLAMATIGLWWMYKDEDWYKELKPKEKFMYWHFPVDWPEPTLVRIPRAFEVGLVFSALPEAFLDSWYREDPEGVKEWMKVFMQTSIPNPAPVLPRVAAEQWKNEVFYFDRPIVPTREERKDPNEQYNEYTTKTAIKLAEIFSVGPVELSPMRIDHALTGVFGYTARDVLELLGLGGPELSREKEAADIPLFGRLFQRGGEVGTRPKSIQQVYDQLEDLQRIQYSSVKMETEEQRQRRLMLTDAANAISALFYVRRYTDRSDQRQALTREGLDIARDVLKTMKSDETVRGRFQTYRRQAEIRKEIMEAEQEGRPPDLGQGQRQRRPTRPRRPSR